MDRAPRLNRERLAVLAGLLMLAGYAAFLHHHTAFSVGGADSAGYLSATRALMEGRILRPIAALRELDLPTELDRLFIDAHARFPGRWEELDKVGDVSLWRIEPNPDSPPR